MDKYIKKLLTTDYRAIIPEFGAIQASQDEPGVLSFNKYLNFDDGKLVQALSEGENISEAEAREKIKAFAEDLNTKVNNKETVGIAGIGTFKKDEYDALVFLQDTAYVPMEREASSTTVTTEASEAANKEDVAENVANTDTIPTYVSSEDNSKRKWMWILLILLLLLIGLDIAFFVVNKDNAVYKLFFGDKEKTEQIDEAARAKAKAEAEAKAKAEKERKEAEERARKEAEEKAAAEAAAQVATSARQLDKRYNIIVGSYKNEAQAQRKVEDLHAKGFTDAFVGIRKNYYVAVIGAFSNITQAEKMQEQIVEGKYHIESWITNSGENEK